MTSSNVHGDFSVNLSDVKVKLVLMKEDKVYDDAFVLLSERTWSQLISNMRDLKRDVAKLLLAPGAPGSLTLSASSSSSLVTTAASERTNDVVK